MSRDRRQLHIPAVAACIDPWPMCQGYLHSIWSLIFFLESMHIVLVVDAIRQVKNQSVLPLSKISDSLYYVRLVI